MNAIKEWFVSGAIHLAVGFVIGWIVFKRPEWVSTFFAWVRSKVGF
ncbi:MAG TPA: hypothetical protein VIY48_17840 [Candidatus Paceibacterota bacterium]